MSLQSRQASGKQAMIQSANQAVGDASTPPSAAWYLTKIEMEPGLTTATMAGGATASDTAISLSSGTGANLPDNTNTPYRVKVTNALFPGVFEVMNVTNIAGDTITVERGKDETTAEIWGPSSVVAPRFIEPTYKVALTLVASRPIVIAESDDGIVLCEYSSAFVSGSTYETTYILHCHDPADGSVIWSHTVSETTTGGNNTTVVHGSISGNRLAFMPRHWAGSSSSPSAVDCKLVLLSISDGTEIWDASISSVHLAAHGSALNTHCPIVRIVGDYVIVATNGRRGAPVFGYIYTHRFLLTDGTYSYDETTPTTILFNMDGRPCSITPNGHILFLAFTTSVGSGDPPREIYDINGTSTTGDVTSVYGAKTSASWYHAHSSIDSVAYVYSALRTSGSPASPELIRKIDTGTYATSFEPLDSGSGGASTVTEGPRFAEANGFIYGLSFFNSDIEPIFSPRPAREDVDGEFVSYTNAFTPISDRNGSMYFISANYDKVHNYIDDL